MADGKRIEVVQRLTVENWQLRKELKCLTEEHDELHQRFSELTDDNNRLLRLVANLSFELHGNARQSRRSQKEEELLDLIQWDEERPVASVSKVPLEPCDPLLSPSVKDHSSERQLYPSQPGSVRREITSATDLIGLVSYMDRVSGFIWSTEVGSCMIKNAKSIKAILPRGTWVRFDAVPFNGARGGSEYRATRWEEIPPILPTRVNGSRIFVETYLQFDRDEGTGEASMIGWSDDVGRVLDDHRYCIANLGVRSHVLVFKIRPKPPNNCHWVVESVLND